MIRRPLSPATRQCTLSVLALLTCLSILPAYSQGHSVRGNRVVVDRATHWQNWQGAASLVDVSRTGTVRPLFVRKNINAALDIARRNVTGLGGVQVGSGNSTAALAIDGDMSTSWGPDPRSDLGDWWIEVNLGRLVVVEKIILHFAEEGEGDPFLQFKVMAWRPPPPRSTTTYLLEGTQIPRYWEIGRTAKPSKTQRLFEFTPRTTEGSNEAFIGDPLDRIQIVAISSDSSRAVEVTPEQYGELPSLSQGAIEYFRRELSGRETRISQSEYETIDPARQGPIRYYRREIPRIAEIEIVSAGDNVNLGLTERGGSATIEFGKGDVKDIGATIGDGIYETGHNGSAFDELSYEFLQDLGALFWVDTIQFLTDGASAIDQFNVSVSDGTRAPDGSISYVPVGDLSGTGAEFQGSGGVRYRQFDMSTGKVRYLRARFANPLNSLSYVGFTEIMLYGEGYVPEVVLTSDLVQLSSSRNLISLDWEGETPEGTTIALQTRSGNQLEEVKEYFDSGGNPVTESRYNRLPGSKKGEIRANFEPGNDWSPWSEPLTVPGSAVTSPSPRQFLQMRATLLSDRPDTAAALRAVTLNMAAPVAEQLLSEVFPLRVPHAGDAEDLTYYLRPTFVGGAQGFDEIRIEATAGTRMELVGLRQGRATDFTNGTTTDFDLSELEVLSVAPDTMHLRLPRRVTRGTELLALTLRSTILGNSASFRGFVRDSRAGEDWQRIDEGNASDEVESQRVTVLALAGAEVIRNLTFRSAAGVLTPNGDNINDALDVSFDVARVSGDEPVALTVHDLSGRLVRQIEEHRADLRGSYTLSWDGLSGRGDVVPPGLYVLRLEVPVDSGVARNTVVQKVVHVVY